MVREWDDGDVAECEEVAAFYRDYGVIMAVRAVYSDVLVAF